MRGSLARIVSADGPVVSQRAGPTWQRMRYVRASPRRATRAARRPRRRAPAGHRLLRRAPRPGRSRPSGWRSAPRGTAGPACAAFNEDHIVATSQAICRVPARSRAPTGRSSSAATPTRCREPAMVTALEVFAANGVTRADRQPRRLHADARRCRTRSSPTTGAAPPAWPTAWWSRRRTTRPADGGFKYNPPQRRARPTPTPPGGSRTGPTS